MIKTTYPLLVICLVMGLLLSSINYITKDIITDRRNSDAEAQRKEVISADTFEKLNDWDSEILDSTASDIVKDVYKAQTSGVTSGYVITASPKGYGGNINVSIGIGIDRKVTGVIIGDSNETPGLGSKVKEEDFRNQFAGISLGNDIKAVKGKSSGDKEISAISGATISSKAVTSAVNAAMDVAESLIEDEGSIKKEVSNK